MKDSEIRQQLLRSGNVRPQPCLFLHQLGKTERNKQRKKLAATLDKLEQKA